MMFYLYFLGIFYIFMNEFRDIPSFAFRKFTIHRNFSVVNGSAGKTRERKHLKS